MIKTCLWRCLILLFAIFALTACEHNYPLVWSPDGTTMALVAEDGLRIGDAQGNLGPPILPVTDATFSASTVSWLPDSKRLLVVGDFGVSSWTAAQSYLADQQQKDSISLAQYIKERLQTAGDSALNDDLRMKSAPQWEVQAAALYLMATDRDAIKSTVSAETFKGLSGVALDVKNVRMYTVKPVALPDAKELWRGFDEVADIDVAPDGRHALLVRLNPIEDALGGEIDLLPLDIPGPPVKVAETRTSDVAWSSDSRSILFTSAAGTTEDAKLGSLVMVDLLDQNGSLLQEPKAQRLARLCLDPTPHIRVLKDGRILFATSPVQLPATEHDIGSKQDVFSFAPGDKLVRRLMAAQDSEQISSIDSLNVSPGQALASLASIAGNTLRILNINAGNVEQLSFLSKFEPCWRTADEICFTKKVDKPGPNQHNAEVVLHSVSKNEDRVISANWPKSAVDGFLIESKNK